MFHFIVNKGFWNRNEGWGELTSLMKGQSLADWHRRAAADDWGGNGIDRLLGLRGTV